MDWSASPRSTASTTTDSSRVPRAAGLGGLRVDRRRAEGHLAAVAQHRLADLGALADRCQSLGLLLDDVDDRAEQVSVCARLMDRVGSRGAVPKTSAVTSSPSSAESGQAVKPDPAVRDQGHPELWSAGAPGTTHGVAESRATEAAPGHLPRPGSRGPSARQAMAGGGHATSLFVCRRAKSAATSQFSSLAWNHL